METVIRTKVKDLLKSEPGREVLAKGWVRTKRGNKKSPGDNVNWRKNNATY